MKSENVCEQKKKDDNYLNEIEYAKDIGYIQYLDRKEQKY